MRARLTEYVKVHRLTSAELKGAVKMNAALSNITGKPEGVKLIEFISVANESLSDNTDLN